MKTITLFIFLGMMIPGATPAISQTSNLTCAIGGDQLCADTVARVRLFTPKIVDGKVYLHWNVSRQAMDGVYVIYRSDDGQNYEVVGQKNGVGTPIFNEVSYYFTDDFLARGVIHYKVLHLSRDMTFLASESVSVSGAEKRILSATK